MSTSLKEHIRRSAVNTIRPLALRLGFVEQGNDRSASYEKNTLLENLFSILAQINFQPQHIVDVGANHGTWTRETLKHFPNAVYTLIEPQSWMKDSIHDLLKASDKIQFFGVGAGEREGTFKFTLVDRDDSCSFNYSESQALADGYKQIDVQVVSLNSFLPTVCPLVPDLIKIDAEGLDLEVLKGASDYFGKTEIFMVEAGIVNKLFHNGFLDIVNFMDMQGYRLFEITDLNRPLATRVLWLAELVFVRKNGIIDSKSFV